VCAVIVVFVTKIVVVVMINLDVIVFDVVLVVVLVVRSVSVLRPCWRLFRAECGCSKRACVRAGVRACVHVDQCTRARVCLCAFECTCVYM